MDMAVGPGFGGAEAFGAEPPDAAGVDGFVAGATRTGAGVGAAGTVTCVASAMRTAAAAGAGAGSLAV